MRGAARIPLHRNDLFFDKNTGALLQLGVRCREVEIHADTLPVKRFLFNNFVCRQRLLEQAWNNSLELNRSETGTNSLIFLGTMALGAAGPIRNPELSNFPSTRQLILFPKKNKMKISEKKFDLVCVIHGIQL
jgi:hypothetical protein